MAESQGFWSYVHADDQAEGGRISRLAKDIAAQFQMMTGEAIFLFLDKDAIQWGEAWRDKIDSSLASVAFFIPVMTPRFFMSPECRRELQFFARQASRLGVGELVLPLLSVDVSGIHDESAQDHLIALVRTFQWEDWRELRFEEIESKEYRRAVARLATRLVEANRNAEQVNVANITRENQESPDSGTDDAPGFLDEVAQAEDTFPNWVENIKSIGRDITLIRQVMEKATADIDQRTGTGFSSRLAVARRVARELVEPTERIWASGNEFASHLHDVDRGFRAILERVPAEIENDPESKDAICTFFSAIRNMSAAAHQALQSVQIMINAIEPIERMSRDLRPVLRRLRQGLTIMVEAREVTKEWVQLIETTGVECEQANHVQAE